MRWMLLLLPLCFLTTSCSTSRAYVAPTWVTPTECRQSCDEAPPPRNPAKDYVKDLLGWGYSCKALQEDCRTRLQEFDNGGDREIGENR